MVWCCTPRGAWCKSHWTTWSVFLALTVTAHSAAAGQVLLNNGDRITGRVVRLADKELVVETAGAGEIAIESTKIKTFSSVEPLRIRIGRGALFESRVASGPDGKIEIRRLPQSAPELVAIVDITTINAPAPAWTGEIMLNGKITGGDSKTTEAGLEFALDKEWTRDRLHFTGEYMYGRERSRETGLTSTTDDFGNGYGKYEHDVHDKFYVDVNAKVIHDLLAELKYRVSPAAGVGYRWFYGPALELFTDIGVAYTDERFQTFGGRSFWGPQLEYGVEWKPVKRLRLFNTLEYYPSFSDFSGNYLIDTQAGFHVTMWRHSFFEIRGEYHHDTQPAASAKKGDYRFILGPGWEF